MQSLTLEAAFLLSWWWSTQLQYIQIMFPVVVKSGCMSEFILRALAALGINLYL